MQIVSWNVNGIRACFNKGALFNMLEQENPDVLFIQETKCQPDQLPVELENPKGYYSDYHSAIKKGYSSVAVFTKKKPIQIFKKIGIEEFDNEGRIIGVEFENFITFGVYFPNGQQSDDRLNYKLRFYQSFFDYCKEIKSFYKKPILISGDFNTAHKEIDLARPKENQDVSGFLPIEREWLDKVVDEYNYFDTFRMFNTQADQYSWWTYRANARARNIGWRIDYIFASDDAKSMIQDAFILQKVMGSDHCPVGIKITENA